MRLQQVRLLASFAIVSTCLLAGCSGGGTAGGFDGATTGSTGTTTGGTTGGSTSGAGATSSSYTYAYSFGSSGTGNGDFSAPRGIARDSSGNIYVTDGIVQTSGYGNNRIEEFTSKGVFEASITGAGANSAEFEAPISVAVDSSDNLYCAVYPGQVLQLSPTGNVNETIGSQGTGAGQYTNPYSVLIGQNGLLYVTDFGRNEVDEYTTAGVFQTAIGSGTLLQPWGAATDSAGDVFVTDNGHSQVVKFSSAGAELAHFGPTGSYTNLQGIAVDSSGDVYVVDSAGCVVYKYDNNGNLLTSFGSSGAGSGEFTSPSGILVDPSGNVYVVDSGNDRVEVFTPSASGSARRW